MITSDDVRSLIAATGMKQYQIAAAVGVTQPTVSRWVKGATPDPGQQAALLELFNKAGVPLAGTSYAAPVIAREFATTAYRDAPEAPEFDKALFPRDVPLRGIAACGDDASFILNGQTGDYVRRPPGIAGRRSVYALNVFGDSMYPVYRHNALVYVDPHRTPAVTEDAVIELHPEDPNDGEPGRGFLKRVKAIRSGKIVCEQFNPPGEIEFDRSDVKSFHRVIPWEEVLGY